MALNQKSVSLLDSSSSRMLIVPKCSMDSYNSLIKEGKRDEAIRKCVGLAFDKEDYLSALSKSIATSTAMLVDKLSGNDVALVNMSGPLLFVMRFTDSEGVHLLTFELG